MGYRFDEKGHVHLLDGNPLYGTTTVIDEALGGGSSFMWWASGMALKAFGWVPLNKDNDGKIQYKEVERMENQANVARIKAAEALGRIRGMDGNDYFKLVHDAYRAHSTEKEATADDGTEMHMELERYVKLCIDRGGLPLSDKDFSSKDDRVHLFVVWACVNVRKFLWSEACHYSRELWTGGKSDFGYEDLEGKVVLGDFKRSKSVYFKHLVQAGSYSLQIEENGLFDGNGAILRQPFKVDRVAVFPFGSGFERPTVRADVDGWAAAFINTLDLYKLKQEFEGK